MRFTAKALVLTRGWPAAALLALAVLALPHGVLAQGTSTPPLQATIFFRPPPPPFAPTAPITIVLQIKNPGSSTVLTTEGFPKTDFWRLLFFIDPTGATITNTSGAQIHGESRVFYCFSRQRVLQRPTAIPVVPVEVVAGDSLLEFEIPARNFYTLTRPGHYTVNARIPVQTFVASDPNAVISDCDQFEGETVVNVGPAAGTGRQDFTIVSNTLEFDILGDSTPPTTTVTRLPAPNAAGWNKQDVTLTFNASDDPGGSGVARIVVETSGAQPGTQTFVGATGALTISAEGNTTVRFHAEDNASNAEQPQTLLVRVDKSLPDVTLSPGSGSFTLNETITVTFGATDPGPATGAASSGLDAVQATITFPGGSPTPLTSGTAVTLNRGGTTTVNVTARDTAGNQASRSAQYKVPLYTFVGFGNPVGAESPCSASASPRLTAKLGSTVPVKFQLFDVNNVLVSTAVATISVRQISGTPPAQEPMELGTGATDTGNRFRFDPTSNQYIFNLNTKVLSAGVWCVSANPDDGTSHSAPIGLR